MYKIIALLCFLVASPVLAQDAVNVIPKLEDTGQMFGYRVFQATLEAPRFTGWFVVQNVSKVVFEVFWDDVNGNVTEIEMRCWTARDTMSFGSGSGFQVTTPVSTSLAGKTLYKQKKFSWEFPDGDTAFEWIVEIPHARQLECGFYAAAGTSGMGDRLTVFLRGATP